MYKLFQIIIKFQVEKADRGEVNEDRSIFIFLSTFMNDINPGAMKEIRDSIDHEKIQVLCLNGVKIDVKEELHGSVQCKMDNFATNLRTIRAIWRIFMLKKVSYGILRPELAFCRDIPSQGKIPIPEMKK